MYIHTIIVLHHFYLFFLELCTFKLKAEQPETENHSN